MDKSTSEFVHEIENKKEKDRKNKQSQGNQNPAQKLPNKKH